MGSQAKTTPCNSLNIFSTNRSTQARWPRRPLSALTSAPLTPVSGFSSTERLRSSPTTRAWEVQEELLLELAKEEQAQPSRRLTKSFLGTIVFSWNSNAF